MRFLMNRVAKLYTGLISIAAGAGGLLCVNVQLVPAALSQQPAASTTASVGAASRPMPTETTTVTAAPSPTAVSTPTTPSSATTTADAATQGPLGPVKFEITQVTLKNLSKAVEPTATWMKKNPGERILLVGHGDPKTRTRDYMEVGRARALTVRRALLDWGVTAPRMQVQPAEMEGDKIKGSEEFASTVEVRLLPKGER
jgi:outer membrane protein OmpA-like peptidoglycan-associated protein